MGYESVFKPGLFEGQTIIVTGGGSSIGRCTAHELASLGAKVVITGRRREKLEATAEEIGQDGGAVDLEDFDIREEDKVKAAVATIVGRNGPIHGLVNNAGGQFPARLEDISQKGWETVVRTNLTGGFLMSREVYLQSMEQHGGAIVNIIADIWRSMASMGHSGAARAGMLSFTETAAMEWAHARVRVNTVAPGWVASSGLDTYEGEVRERTKTLPGHSPLARIATEAEISAAIVFLLSPAAGYITGSCIRVDGGVPNKPVHATIRRGEPTLPFEGFHRAVRPKVLDEE